MGLEAELGRDLQLTERVPFLEWMLKKTNRSEAAIKLAEQELGSVSEIDIAVGRMTRGIDVDLLL